MNTTEIGIGGNRKHKDTLFRKIFGTEEHKHYLLSLYNDSGIDAVTKSELEKRIKFSKLVIGE